MPQLTVVSASRTVAVFASEDCGWRDTRKGWATTRNDSAEGVGYLLKNRINDITDFLAAVRRVASGGSAIDPIIISTLLSKRRSDDPLGDLTPREREILVLMAEGRSNQGIADRLVVTLRAVERHVSTIFGKLGLPSTGTESRRVLAVLLYLRA